MQDQRRARGATALLCVLLVPASALWLGWRGATAQSAATVESRAVDSRAVDSRAVASVAPYPAKSAPPAALAWLADRDADRVSLIDEDLVEMVGVGLPGPERVAARRDGAAWVVAGRGTIVAEREDLWLVHSDGSSAKLAALGPVRDLACLNERDALVVEGAWTQALVRVLRLDRHGAVRQLCVWPAGSAVAGAGDRVLLGTQSGACVLFDANAVHGPVLARVGLGVEVSDVAPAAGGGWWVVGGASGTRLWKLDGNLKIVVERDLGGTIDGLAATPSGAAVERLWLPRAGQPWLLAVGADGRTELDVDLTSVGPVLRGDGLPDAGALFAAGGFVLRVDVRGRLAATQGGFDWLVDAAGVPRP